MRRQENVTVRQAGPESIVTHPVHPIITAKIVRKSLNVKIEPQPIIQQVKNPFQYL